MKIRTTLLGALVALAASAPAAHAHEYDPADVSVCNEATPVSLGGSLEALPGDPLPPARFADERLQEHRGEGAGLVHAALHSPALQQCAPADVGGGDDGGIN
jgi:hypothetical protein